MARRSMEVAIAALLVLVAVGASPAWGQQGLLTAEGPVTLNGTQTGEVEGPVTLIGTQTGEAGSNALTVFGGETECPKAIYTGHKVGATPHELVPAGATAITITPHYGACEVAGLPATMEMNGCDLAFDLEGEEAEGTYGVKTTVVCFGGKHVQWTAFSSESHSVESRFCTLTFTEKESGYTGLHATDTGNGKIDVSGTLGGITAHRSGNGLLCPVATTESAELAVDITIEAKNAKGEATAVALRGEAEQGELVSDIVKGLNALTAFGGETACPEATYTGNEIGATPHEPIGSGAAAVTVTPHYGTCDISGLPATVDMNGCDYAFDLEEEASEGTFDVRTTVVCSGGKHVQWTAFSSESHSVGSRFCTLTFTEKEAGYTGLHATDTGNGEIDVSGTLEGITVDRSGGGILCPEGTTEAAKLDVDITLQGEDEEGGPTAISLSAEEELPEGEGKERLTSEGPVTLTGVETGEGSNLILAFGSKVACPGSTYTGHRYAVTPGELIKHSATTVALTPHYNQEACIAAGIFPATVDTNGCDYVLHLGETSGASDTYKVTIDVRCPVEKEIVLTIFTTKGEDPSTAFCTLRIKPQTGLSGAIVRDTTNGTLDISGTVIGLHITRSNHGAHNVLCPNNTTTSVAEAPVDLAVSGHDADGEPTPIALSD